MNRIKISIWVIAVSICVWFTPLQTSASSSAPIQLKDVKLDVQESSTSRQLITNSPIELIGPEQEVTFYYELRSDAAKEDNELVLNVKHSELLIAPSSLTISVDGQAITSKSLNGEQMTEQITIPLTGEALEKGIHSVTVSFYGIIIEGVCVDQGTSGNWLTIGIDSYFQLSGQLSEELQSLSDYPRIFLGTTNSPVRIVIPDKASMSTLNNGMIIAAYLAERSDVDEAVQVVRESSVKTISGNVIFLGAKSEFTTPFMKDLLQKARLPINDDSLVLSRHELVDGNQKIEALIVMADSPEDFEKRIEVLMDAQFIKQLSGEQLSITKVPDKIKEVYQRKIPLKKFAMENLTLDSYQGKSQNFYYYVPAAFQEHQAISLELHIKRSETITAKEKQEEDDLLNRNVELVVLVNDVPHSVDIRALTDAKDGIFTVNVPIDASAIGENRMINLQFASNGLRQKNPCVSTDENRWIYIMEDSFFTFPLEDSSGIRTLASYPSPFAGEQDDTTIVLPNDMNIEDNQLLHLYRSLSVWGSLPNLTLNAAKDITTQDLSGRHVVFIGGPDVQPLLNDIREDLTVPYEDGAPNLQLFGFIPEAVEMFSWIQQNPWSDKQHSMFVFDHNAPENVTMDKKFLDFLKNMNEVSTIAVKMNNQQFYTNAVQLEKVVGEVKDVHLDNDDEESALSNWWIVGFIGLLAFVAVLMVVLFKKRKQQI